MRRGTYIQNYASEKSPYIDDILVLLFWILLVWIFKLLYNKIDKSVSRYHLYHDTAESHLLEYANNFMMLQHVFRDNLIGLDFACH